MKKALCLFLALLLIGCASPTPTPLPPTPLPPTATPTAAPTVTPTAAPTATPELPNRILLIGNSFGGGYLGVDRHLIGLGASDSPALTIETSNVIGMAYHLDDHWRDGEALEAIQEGNWDVVILQDVPIGEDQEQSFTEDVRRFDEAIKKTGARTVLFMLWQVTKQLTTERIARAYSNVGAELGVKVAPVGLAFERALQEGPALGLFTEDGYHPSVAGTYLASCVLYATIYERSPVGCSYQPADALPDSDSSKSVQRMREQWQMTEEEVAFLQRIAWETVQEYQGQE